jgi:starch phosphorylase
MRESMALLTPRFSANRVVREYTEQHYLPAAAAYRARAAERGTPANGLRAWQRHLERHWSEARFGTTTVETRDGQHHFMVQIELGHLDPDSVRVELYADASDAADPVRQPMSREPMGLGGVCVYACAVPDSRPASHYTPRLVPYHALARVPLEAPWILWQDRRAP